jgi:hypothetical protein
VTGTVPAQPTAGPDVVTAEADRDRH